MFLQNTTRELITELQNEDFSEELFEQVDKQFGNLVDGLDIYLSVIAYIENIDDFNDSGSVYFGDYQQFLVDEETTSQKLAKDKLIYIYSKTTEHSGYSSLYSQIFSKALDLCIPFQRGDT